MAHRNQDRQDDQAYRRLRLEMIAAERAEVIRLRDADHIGDDVLRRVQEDLDLQEVLLTNPEEGAGHDLSGANRKGDGRDSRR